MTGKRQRLARARRAAGYTQEALAEQLNVTPSTVANWESGRTEPLAYKRPKLAKVLRVSPARLEDLLANESLTLASAEPLKPPADLVVTTSLPNSIGKLDAAYVESIHARIQELVRMDMHFGGDHSSGLALKLFQSVVRKLGSAEIDPTIEADLYSAAGELGELAGWLLFDAGKHELVRRVNNEALNLLRMAGDRSMEILTLQNMSMHAGFLERPREALRLADMVLAQNKLSPRLRALFLTRKARAFALGGDDVSADRSFDEATSLYLDGVRDDDPAWAWWITDQELAWHRAMIHSDNGDWFTAVDSFEESVAGMAPHAVRGRYIHLASLLSAQSKANNWADMEQTIETIMPYVDEVGSTRTANILHKAVPGIEMAALAPRPVRDSATELKRLLVDAGYDATT